MMFLCLCDIGCIFSSFFFCLFGFSLLFSWSAWPKAWPSGLQLQHLGTWPCRWWNSGSHWAQEKPQLTPGSASSHSICSLTSHQCDSCQHTLSAETDKHFDSGKYSKGVSLWGFECFLLYRNNKIWEYMYLLLYH